MGSKLNSKKIDSSVGGLVWVRRRNGSWWPGRIMGLHELSGNCLVSSRSGTPVKLLGREDASLDWYNLETSKRVKAFRCGEFGDCIEKAKVSAVHSNKKAVKYARREDAILHALDLECARTNKDHEFKRMDGSSGKEHEYMDGEGSKQELSQSGISFEDPIDSTHKVPSLLKKRWKTPNDSEDDRKEGSKRMRGLGDLVNGVEAKGKPNIHNNTEASDQLDCASLGEHNTDTRLKYVNSSKSSCSYLKRRRDHVFNFCENLKRKNRRRQLRKVLESSVMVSVPIFGDDDSSSGLSYFQGLRDRKASSIESTDLKTTNYSLLIYNSSDFVRVSCEKQTSPDASESRNSEFSSMLEIPENDFSGSLFDVPFIDEETHSGGLSPLFSQCVSRKLQSNHFSQLKPISLSCEGLVKYGSTSPTIQHNNSSRRTKKGTSRWQLKGKRNSRSLGKKMSKRLDLTRSVERDVEADDFVPDMRHMDGFSVGRPEVHINTLDGPLMSDDGNPKYLNSLKYGGQSLENRDIHIDSSVGGGGKCTSLSRGKSVAAKSKTLMPPRSPSQQQSFFTGNSRHEISDVSSINFQWNSSLFNVDVEIRASNNDQNVPLVSLMSKFSGKAIVGHPLTVEVCTSGYCDILMNSLNYSSHSDGQNFAYQYGEDKAVGGTLQAETGYTNQLHLEAQRRKPISHSKKSSKKKKKHVISSKKTRKLSSFSMLPKEEKKTVVEKLTDSTLMACIPLTVVFSRISESLS